MSTSLDRIIEELTPYLASYLERMGINLSKAHFSCINKGHDDSDPSMALVPASNGQIAHCFGCGASYNIFHAAHHLENKPIKGKEFITENIAYLAKMFSIEFQPEEIELTQEQIECMRYRSLYEDAAAVIREIGTHELAAKKGWTPETCKRMDIGTIDWEIFEQRICNKGTYTPEELRSKDITPRLFNNNLITFTIRDYKGRVAGFVARNMDFDKKDKSKGPKFCNTSDTVPIYSKRNLLYGMEIAKDYTEARLDILEGYGDLVTAQQAGHKSCVALGGVALTEEHVKLVKDIGFTHVNLILDGDKTGIDKMRLYLDRFSGREGLKVTVAVLPFEDSQPMEQRDPDDFIKEYGLKEFLSVKTMTSFDWRLKDLESQSIAKQEIAEKLIPYIVSETNAIERGRMCKELANKTDVKEEDIRDEVKRKVNNQIKEVGESLRNKLSRATDAIDIKEAISIATEQINKVSEEKDKGVLHSVRVLEHLDNWLSNALNPPDGLPGWYTGIESLDDPVILGGIPKKESILTFGGQPNHGKSAILINLAKGMILNEHNRNLTVAFWSLDDAVNVLWIKMLASLARFPTLDIKRPDRRIMKDEALKKRFNGWYDWLRTQVKNNKILAKGHDIGNDINAAEAWIKYIQDSTGNNVVLLIDAVHDMATGNSKYDSDERIKFVRVYDWFQRATEQHKFSVATCAHITKMGMSKARPEQSDLSETGKAIYSSKVIGMVYSQLDHFSSLHKRDAASMYWTDEDSISLDNRKPIVELDITKCKETSYKGTIYLRHDNDCCYMDEISAKEMKQKISQQTKRSPTEFKEIITSNPDNDTKSSLILDDISPFTKSK